VFGESVAGYSWHNGGAFAEYVAAPEAALARKPAALSFEEAAAVPTSGLIALSAVRDQAKVQPGWHVLVNGAGGGVGMIALQLAKAYGAQVTGVDSAAKLELMRSLGADHVIDYAADDFTRGSTRYDALIDVASTRPFRELRRALAPSGKYVMIGHDQYGAAGARWFGSIPRFVRLMARTPFTDQLPKLDFSMPDKTTGMAHLAELVEAGKLRVAVDRTFPLGEVPAALRYLEAGHARGKVVISV
jgi:NADPH:quinone reductase-like Zn-dependent oxidoreductase